MKAIFHEKYGSPDLLRLKEVEKPFSKDDEVLVKILVSSINYGDNVIVRGKPFIIRLMGYGFFNPKSRILGGDLAGRVESVGSDVKQFQPGDEVYADVGDSGLGAYAEYLSVPEKVLALKLINLTFEEAATIPQAAVVALQGLRKGGVQSGHKVLINGASGGVGSFAVQITKSLETEVTGVCSTRNADLVRSIGADHVIDYTKENFTQSEQKYDLIIDVVAKSSFSECNPILKPNGRYVTTAFTPGLALKAKMVRGDKKMIPMLASPERNDLIYLKDLLESGKLKPIIDRRYTLEQVSDAIRYLEEGHVKGKLIINIKE